MSFGVFEDLVDKITDFINSLIQIPIFIFDLNAEEVVIGKMFSIQRNDLFVVFFVFVQ